MRHVLVPPDIDAAGPALGARMHALEGLTMGTSWSVKLAGSCSLDLSVLQEAVQRQLDSVVAQMSTWLPASDLSRFNRAAAGEWQSIPAACFDVLRMALHVAQASGGAFDPTAGPLVNLWGFGPDRRHDSPGFVPPGVLQVDRAHARTGWRRLLLDEASLSVLQPGDIELDFSGIAKGFGVDQVARELQKLGIRNFLVEVGGELRGAGVKPDGQPWWVALERPPDIKDRLPEAVVALHGLSIATSGDYRQYFQLNGSRHTHTIDPRDGWPVRNGLASVTVLHRDAMLADAWATALTVLGAADGLALADAQGLAACFICRLEKGGVTEHWSRAFQGMAT